MNLQQELGKLDLRLTNRIGKQDRAIGIIGHHQKELREDMAELQEYKKRVKLAIDEIRTNIKRLDFVISAKHKKSWLQKLLRN